MESILRQLDRAFRTAIRAAYDLDADPIVGPSQNEKFGDYQSNAAMGLAKVVSDKTGQKTNPRAVAEQIKSKLALGEMATEITIAGPGFINVRLSPKWLAGQLQSIAPDPRLGIAPTASPQTVVVDYSGPNIAKQMHVGHLRSTIIGDAISRVIEFQGHMVIRQNHIGDWGTQFGKVMLALWYDASANAHDESARLERWVQSSADIAKLDETPGKTKQAELLAEIGPFHQKWVMDDLDGDRFFGPYLQRSFPNLDRLERLYTFVGRITGWDGAHAVQIFHPRHQNKPLDELPSLVATFVQQPNAELNQVEGVAWVRAVDITLATCDGIYRRLNVLLVDTKRQVEPIVRGESFYKDRLAEVVGDLTKSGIADRSDGAVVIFVDGPDKAPLIIQKSDGGYLYGTTDLAAIRYRINQLHADRIIYTHDSRQAQHFSQVFRTADKASWTRHGEVKLEYAPFGTMLGEDGKPFKTRDGDTVKLANLLDEAEERAQKVVDEKNPELPADHRIAIAKAVGIGGVKYSDLSKDRISDYVFSWDKMLALDGNTAPYLQYAYARIRSIFRKATERGFAPGPIALESPYELAIAKQVLRFDEVIEIVARELKPHHLCTYLYELATKFSGFFENCPVIQSEYPVRGSRLSLIDLTARTLAQGLNLLGIEHPDQM